MPADLTAIKTIVVVMMENRSFDHMLGYLSLPAYGRTDVDGLRDDPAWIARFINPSNGTGYAPFHLGGPNQPLPDDPVHDRSHIAIQLGSAALPFPMNGFVRSCSTLDPVAQKPIVMGFFTGDDLPTTHFFTENFAICDRWFSAIPASTQPNCLMAASGVTAIDDNVRILPEQDLVYDWLARIIHTSSCAPGPRVV